MLSASSVTTFLRCGVQWEFAYVKRIRSAPTIKQIIGIGAHDAFEQNLAAKMVTKIDLPESVVRDAFSDSYDHLLGDVEVPAEDPGVAKDQGLRLVSKQHTEIAPGIQPVLVEAPIQFEINGVIWTGTLDLKDGKGVVRDWKTSVRKPSSPAQYQLAMTGYAIGARELTGEIETDVQLDFLVRYKKQEPGYYPIPSGGPIPDSAYAQFANIVGRVQQLIMAGRFVPNGLQNNACSWCGYRDICPDYNQR